MLLLWMLLPTTLGQIYNGSKYFDKNNRIRADCVVPDVGYNYLGERHHAIDGSPCVPWNHAVAEFKDQNGLLTETLDVSELADHNFCRRVTLSSSHPFISFTDPKNQIATSGKAPWCYVKKTGVKWQNLTVSPSECFPACNGSSQREKTQRTPYGFHQVDQNYNRMLDRIDLYFKSYNWGDESYYDWKPSEQALSKQYHIIRVQLFFGALGSLALMVVLLIGCYFLKRNATSSRQKREQALKEIYNIEDDNPMRQVISRPAPN